MASCTTRIGGPTQRTVWLIRRKATPPLRVQKACDVGLRHAAADILLGRKRAREEQIMKPFEEHCLQNLFAKWPVAALKSWLQFECPPVHGEHGPMECMQIEEGVHYAWFEPL